MLDCCAISRIEAFSIWHPVSIRHLADAPAFFTGKPLASIMRSLRKANDAEMAPLLAMLRAAGPVDTKLSAFVSANAYPVTVRKGKLLLQEGAVCTHIYFILKGVLRGYIKDGRTLTTTWITTEWQMAASISSFIYQQAAPDFVQALEDCELLAISYDTMQAAYDKFPSFNLIARKIYEQYYVDAENRALLVRLKSADAKYLNLLRKQPELANRVPLKYIASYLGITVETLSRVRQRLAQPAKQS
ncbi:MAG: Crp/Fnr family transcriptional regulator [Chitinophagaceae bacterium]|nr:MAG: Crp/Fnr family transcriptional regulator [Chitinophagaceae bacterium]